jgi:hypothetical protein
VLEVSIHLYFYWILELFPQSYIFCFSYCICVATSRRVWRYQRSNQNPYIEEEQKTQWPKEKVKKDKQRSTKHTYKIKDRVTWTPLKTGGELRCSGRASSFCSTSGTRRVSLFSKHATYIFRVRFALAADCSILLKNIYAVIKLVTWKMKANNWTWFNL